GGARGRADLEPDALELARQVLDLLVGQVELEREGLQLGRLEIAALLGTLDESARLVGLEQLVQLVLAQLSSVLSGPCVDWVNEPSHSTREVLSMPGVPPALAFPAMPNGARGVVIPRLRALLRAPSAASGQESRTRPSPPRLGRAGP